MAYDPELDLLYIGIGQRLALESEYPQPWRRRQPVSLSSIVALRPDTGEYVWHYQTTPGETWDYTSTQHILLADVTIEGQPRKVLMQAPKNGFFYVLDRTNGQLISAKPFATVNWATAIDPTSGPSRRESTDGALSRIPRHPSLSMPGPVGAHNWHPMSFSPRTGLVYIPVMTCCSSISTIQTSKPTSIGFNIGIDNVAAACRRGIRKAESTPHSRRSTGTLEHGIRSTQKRSGRRAPGRVERRRALDRRRSRIPRQHDRLVRGLRREQRQEAMVVPRANGCRRGAHDVHGRR